MHKDCTCSGVFLAAVILVFSFWEIDASKWIIVVAAALIFLKGIAFLAKSGCNCIKGSCCGIGDKKTGSKLMMEKTDEELHEGPSRKELKEVMKGEKKAAK